MQRCRGRELLNVMLTQSNLSLFECCGSLGVCRDHLKDPCLSKDACLSL